MKKLIRIAKSKDILCFNIVNEVDSEIARMTELGIFLNAGREIAVASTKAFTCQCVVMALLTAWFAEKKTPNKMIFERMELIESLKIFCMKVQECLNEVKFPVKDLANEIKDCDYIAIMGM